MIQRIVSWACVALLAALPAGAAIHYKALTQQEGGAANDAMDIGVEAWIDGEKAKILFTESGNPFMGQGSYLLTTDGGRTLYLVDPESKQYSEWDLDAILKMAGGVLQGMKGVFSLKFSQPRVEMLAEEPGGTLVGLPTTRYRHRTSYTIDMKILGMKRSQAVESVQDVWSTEALGDPALGVWLRKEPPKTGDPELDGLIAAEMSKVRGFPLKMVDETTMTGKKGKQETTRTVTEVTELDRAAVVAAGTFEIPADYAQTQMMPDLTAEGGEEEEEDEGRPSFKKLFGRGDG